MSEVPIYAFEGLDGAGKTTNIELLDEALQERGFEVTTLSSPSHSILGRFIRERMFDFDPWLKDELFVLDMRHSLQTIPDSTNIVLFDRFLDSVYTSNAETDRDALWARTADLPIPRRTFLLDITPELSWEREGVVSDHPLDMDWLRQKHARYQELLDMDKHNFCTVDASQEIHAVFQTLLSTILNDLVEVEEV